MHFTLTSEWKYYKWGPLHNEVPGLENGNGFMFSSVDSVYSSAAIKEVEKELRSQIEKAKRFGIDFTHFDSHMAALFGRADYLKFLMKLGREYKVLVLLVRTGPGFVFNQDITSFVTDTDILVDEIFTASPSDFNPDCN